MGANQVLNACVLMLSPMTSEASCPDAGVILVHGVEWFDVENKLRFESIQNGSEIDRR